MKLLEIVERQIRPIRNIVVFNSPDGSKQFVAGNRMIVIANDVEYDPRLHDRVVDLLTAMNNSSEYACKWIAPAWVLRGKGSLSTTTVIAVIGRKVISDIPFNYDKVDEVVTLSYNEGDNSERWYMRTTVSVEGDRVVVHRDINKFIFQELSAEDVDVFPTDFVNFLKTQIDHN